VEGEPLTVGRELNKLAFNAAFGRNAAGVHFRRDEIEGILTGGAAASRELRGSNTTYNERFRGFSATPFRGIAATWCWWKDGTTRSSIRPAAVSGVLRS
jgi:hypothetical protein